MYGEDDVARKCNLCRDSEKEGRNLQRPSVTDGFFWRHRYNREPLPNTYQTRDLFPGDLCPELCYSRK